MKLTCLSLAALIACSSPPHPTTQASPPTPKATADVVPAPAPARTAGPPLAKVEPVIDALHGTQVRDPYRWMEKGGPEFASFLDAQDAYARKALAAIPGRDQLRAAVHEANRGVTRIDLRGVTGSLVRPRVFLTKRAPDDESPQLYVRDGWDGKDKLLVDPRVRDSDIAHHALGGVYPAPDGKHVAYGVSASGSEDTTLEILDVDQGTVRGEKISRVLDGRGVAWRDNRSFFYRRRRVPSPDRADWFKNSATYLHNLGDDPERAPPVITPLMPELGIAETEFTFVETSPRSPWALGSATTGTSASVQYFLTPLAKVIPGKTPWRRLCGPNDHVAQMGLRGDTIFALSYADAPRYRVLAFDARSGSLATAKVLVPEGTAVLESFAIADDAMYLQLFDAGQTRIERVSFDGKQRSEIKLPFLGTARLLAAYDRPGITLTAEGWTQPPQDFVFDPRSGLRDIALREPWPADYSHLTAELVEATSADGTKVPLSIIRNRAPALDGSAAAFLTAYQAYGVIDRPGFVPIGLAWVSRGGVRAFCHGRGSGNRGEQWHLDGHRQNKERGVEDLIACSEYLIEHKYTTAARLTVSGTSAGGIVAGGAITRRPDLYAAAFLRVPVINLMRFEFSQAGPGNVPEFGSLANAADFAAMLASDPYHRLVDGTRYPAIVLTGGKHDPRVPAWQPAKFAARAQAATASGRPVLLRIESDAGHGIGSTRSQLEEEWTDLFAFALSQSGAAIAR